jgi:tetratricopeptide (TPR) repeat protein
LFARLLHPSFFLLRLFAVLLQGEYVMMRYILLFALALSTGLSSVARPWLQESAAISASAHANRGVALLEQFRFKDASAEFEAVVRLRPDSAAAHVNLAIAYFNQRNFERAFVTLQKAETLAPESPRVHYNLGLVHKLMGRTEAAATAFQRVLALDRDDSMTHYYLGTVYSNLGDLEKAASHLRKAIELQPGNESAHFSLGNVLIRQGNIEEGRKELEIFRKMKETFAANSASAGLQYTELGKYAEAIEEEAPPRQQRPVEAVGASNIQWEEVTEEAGLYWDSLPAPPETPSTVATEEYDRSFVEKHLLPHLGSSLAFRDLDLDEDTDLVVMRAGSPLVFLNQEGRFTPVSDSGLPEAGKYVGITVGDVDNDLDPDIYLAGVGANRLFINEGDGRFIGAPDNSTSGDDISVAASFVDIDHDGDLDIYVTNYLASTVEPHGGPGEHELRVPRDLPGAPNRLYRNNGNGSFSEVAEESRLDGGASRSVGVLFSDLDEDRDIDGLVVNDGEPLQVFSNDRVGTFTETALEWGIEAGGRFRGVDSADYDQDGRFDLFLTAEGSLLNLLLSGESGGVFRPDVLSPWLLSAGVPGPRFGTAFADIDNDSDLDLLVVVNQGEALAAVYQNTPEGFKRTSELRVKDPEVGRGRSLALADVDRDGKLDVAVGTQRGRVVLFRNTSRDTGRWIRVSTRGLRSNKDGFGAKVEVKSGRARQRREVRAASSFLSQSEQPLHFGLGSHTSADYIRFLWPGGVKQIEMDVAGGRTVVIDELNRKGTSCPLLYAWDGQQIRFVTDFLGGSAIGNLLARGQYNYPDTEEIVKLEQFPLVDKSGTFELKWVNQLEEVMMYDKAALIAVDHPVDVEVFPNERLMPAPPYPEPKLYPVRDQRSPLAAWDDRGNDVTDLIAEEDRRYPDSFELLPFKGYAEDHSLTLDLGQLKKDEHVVLLLYGWVDYADSSSNLAASQAGVVGKPPTLEVGDGSGRFELALEQMGFPAGLPKTMLVDLGGLVAPNKNHVRITTNMRLYWDRIRIATLDPSAALIANELRPEKAELSFLGYPAAYSPDGKAPRFYDYSKVAATDLWDAHVGAYTRYGDVRELVESIDDRYVIARHGDELALSFDAGRLPPLGTGWKRTFLVYADGFGKDMDLNSARPDTVEPLPFHGMSAYPYPPDEHYPDTEEHRRYQKAYNTRHIH